MANGKNPFLNLPQSLRRVTSGSAFIPEIDGLRFLAIFPVILQHFSERISRKGPTPTGFNGLLVRVLSNGHIGVLIFFFISGFILTLPFGKQKLLNAPRVSISKYYLRRLTRLEPPYLVCMTLFLFLLVGVYHQKFGELFPHYLASCFYLHRLIYGNWSPINPLAWTLEVEVQFYVFAPLLTLFYFSFAKIRRRAVLIGLILAKLIIANTTPFFTSFSLTLPYYIEYFMLGILFADLYLSEWKDGVSKQRKFDFIAIISIIVLFSSWTWEQNVLLKLIFATSLFLTVYSCFRSVTVNHFFRNNWITALGGMCYTIYLLHLGLAEFIVGKFSHFILLTPWFVTNYIIGLILILPILFVVCVLFFLGIEKPCMDPKWPSKLRTQIASFLRMT